MKFIIRRLMSKVKNWKWFAFAVFLTLLFGITFVAGIIENTYFPTLERLHLSVNILSLLVFWGLGLQKRIFRRFFWRIFFFIDALVFVVLIIFGRKYDFPLLWCIIIWLIIAIVYVPYYIGMFIYAFRSKQIWGQAEHRQGEIFPPYSIYRWARRKSWLKEHVRFLKTPAIVALIILFLIFIPMIIRNIRIIYPQGQPPEYYKRILKYRRTTIPQLKEFERLFPNYLCDLDYSIGKFIIDPNNKRDRIAYLDPNSLVRWSLSAGLHKRYLFVMEIDIVFAKIDPETEDIISPGSHEEPVFSLWEVSFVSAPLRFFGERYTSAPREMVRTLTVDEWEKLVEADRDFRVLGIELKTEDPIPNFELAFRNNR